VTNTLPYDIEFYQVEKINTKLTSEGPLGITQPVIPFIGRF